MVAVDITAQAVNNAVRGAERKQTGKLSMDKTMPDQAPLVDESLARGLSSSSTLVRSDSGDVLAQDQGVDVVGALVGFYGLEIHGVAHDGVVIGYSICPEDVAG